jgi:hypothetical protein
LEPEIEAAKHVPEFVRTPYPEYPSGPGYDTVFPLPPARTPALHRPTSGPQALGTRAITGVRMLALTPSSGCAVTPTVPKPPWRGLESTMS